MPVSQHRSRRLLVAAVVAAAAVAVAVPVGAAERTAAGATPGTGTRGAVSTAAEAEGLGVIVAEQGKISRSVDASGTLDGTGSVTVRKPAGGTVRRAVLITASTGFTGAAQGEVGLNGTVVPLEHAVESSISSVNYWTDVTALLKPALDAAPAGDTEVPVTESAPASIDGVILAVVFSDPGQTRVRSTTILFGATRTTGDHFELVLSKPIFPESPGAVVEMSLGISYGFQESADQFSQVTVNGSRLTTSAGGNDDGEPQDGALITVGGIGDAPANPDPDATATTARSDDELYDLRPYVASGATRIEVDTLNPSNDDNILFAEFTTDPPVTTIITPNPRDDQDMVALGDSFSSGEGTRVYDANREGTACHRGPAAWPRVVERRVAEIVSLDHRACTGAKVANLTGRYKYSGPQVPVVPDPDVDLVTLTVGGNDVGFGGVVVDCVNPAPFATCADDPDSAGFRGRLRTLGLTLDALYRKIEAAYPNARIAHVGYPRLTPLPGVTPIRCGWLSPAEQVAGVRLVQLLNGTIEAAADRRSRVEYVDATEVLAGHELCTENSWVVPIGFSLASEQAHPTATGQVAYGRRVADRLGYSFLPEF